MNVSVPQLALSVATADDAPALVEVIHAAFGARPRLDPPSTAIDETPASVAATLQAGAGILATVDGRPAGALLIAPLSAELVTFQRVSVHPDFQRHGVASAMVAAAQDYAAELGFARVELFARAEFAELIGYWQHRSFRVLRDAPYGVVLGKELPVAIRVATGEAMQELGERLADELAAGDLIIATGALGAGKTTLTQGIGRGLGTTEAVISPTFVLSRTHRTPAGRPDLVHVDAYRLTSSSELDDLDLEASMAEAVTVVEWGEGLAEPLADARLEVDIHIDGSARTVLLRGIGERWRDIGERWRDVALTRLAESCHA